MLMFRSSFRSQELRIKRLIKWIKDDYSRDLPFQRGDRL